MFTYDEKCTMNLADSYTLLYGFIVKHVLAQFGKDGERAVREGTRRYGRDRALTSQKKHLEMGVKINMETLFTIYDLPGDPRFRRKKQRLNPQERVSHTLICPMASLWAEHSLKAVGRIYCEEFHSACYSTYGFGYTQVNLAKTLTQDGDEYCAFNVILRPENLPEALRPICFAEYDKDFQQNEPQELPLTSKAGFNALTVKLYFYLLDAVVERLGEAGATAVEAGLKELANYAARHLANSAHEDGLPLTLQFVEDNFPLYLNADQDTLWEQYSAHDAQARMQKHFWGNFFSQVDI